MKKCINVLTILFVLLSAGFAQKPSMVFFKGELPDSMYLWPWGFLENPTVELGLGYSPGTAALRWVTSAEDGWQGEFIGLNSNSGNDLSSIWTTDSVYFKMRAPNGLAESDTMWLYLYDSRNTDWEYSVWSEIDGFTDLNDGQWHQFSIALADFQNFTNPIDQNDIVAVSFESSSPASQGNNIGIASQLHIDDVWIGDPEIPLTMTFFNGQSLGSEVEFEAWGFQNNELILAEGEGYTEGTPAIIWETSDWDWQGIGFIMNVHDMTYSFTADTIKLKIKAPAGINTLALEWYDVYYDDTHLLARKLLDDITWDGEWQVIEVPLADFSIDEGFDVTQVYEFGIVAADATIPERLHLDEIWLGSPTVSIDITPPPNPTGIIADVSTQYVNLIAWDDITSESGETFDVYASLDPIVDLGNAGVFLVAAGVPENEVAVHHIYYPLTEGQISYYYAVTCTDAASNKSESFGTATTSFTNTGKTRAIISMNAPENFTADGDLSEWQHIMPFRLHPDDNLYTGGIEDSLDYSAYCYVAMDNENLYVAFDVYDDVYTWQESNTQAWWEDEAIEFFIGFYEVGVPHPFFYRGAEPDYRLVFVPNAVFRIGENDTIDLGQTNYYFEPLGGSDYIIEARIPIASIQLEEDSTFTPAEGMTIPFEIFAADADVVDGGNESRLQLGDNSARNPWGDGPEVWTFAWLGLPQFLSIDDQESATVMTYYLGDNYPNPFNPTTTIEYSIAKPGHVELMVYNPLGQRVITLVDEHNSAGVHSVSFDASHLASGVYFYQISTNDFNRVKKMLLLK
jgi:hypothetical protein